MIQARDKQQPFDFRLRHVVFALILSGVIYFLMPYVEFPGCLQAHRDGCMS